METHEIEIEVRPDGTVQARVLGAKGPACLEYARLIEKILGAQGQVELTSEYYEAPTEVQIHVNDETR